MRQRTSLSHSEKSPSPGLRDWWLQRRHRWDSVYLLPTYTHLGVLSSIRTQRWWYTRPGLGWELHWFWWRDPLWLRYQDYTFESVQLFIRRVPLSTLWCCWEANSIHDFSEQSVELSWYPLLLFLQLAFNWGTCSQSRSWNGRHPCNVKGQKLLSLQGDAWLD